MGKLQILLLLSLSTIVLSAAIPLSNFSPLFRREMTQRHHHCSDWIEVMDRSVILNTDIADTEGSITLILKNIITNNQTLEERKYNFGALRLNMPCALVSYNLTEAALRGKNSARKSWPLLPPRKLPGHQQHTYHLIWLSADYQKLSDVTSKLVTLGNAFILLQRNYQLTILTRNLNPNSWYQAGKYREEIIALSLNIQELNFQGSSVPATVCAVCVDNIEDYKKTGLWGDTFLATLFMFTTDFNGTLEPQGVFGLPRDGTNKEGEWDGFIQPTTDGTAVFATIVRASPENQHIIHRTKPLDFISVVFATARPKRVHYSVLQKLIQPLRPTLWLAILISFAAVVASVEFLIHSRIQITSPRIYIEEFGFFRSLVATNALGMLRREALRREKHAHVNTIHAILEPIIDQNGLKSRAFCQNIRHDSTRIVVGLWFLLVIVLNSAYKSMVTSLMVRPSYGRPPTTFRELLASDYHIGCVFFEGNIDVNLKTLNSSMSHQLLQRIESYGYIEPECYQRIFESTSACISYRKVFDVLGLTFTVNLHYQNMAVYSDEHLFPVFQSIGISLYYPAVVDPFNRYIQAFTESGVSEKWQENGRWIQLIKGQRNAKRFAEDKSYYLGNEDSVEASSEEELQMFMQLIGCGIIVAASAFLFEYLYFSVEKLNIFLK